MLKKKEVQVVLSLFLNCPVDRAQNMLTVEG